MTIFFQESDPKSTKIKSQTNIKIQKYEFAVYKLGVGYVWW